MKLRAFASYVRAKHAEKAIWQNYVADCLWAQAAGRVFNDKDNHVTLPRWQEVVNPKKDYHEPKITKEDVKAQFARLKTSS